MSFLQSIEAWVSLRQIDDRVFEGDYESPDETYARLEKYGSLCRSVALFRNCDGRVTADASSITCTHLAALHCTARKRCSRIGHAVQCTALHCFGYPCTALLERAYDIRKPIELIFQVRGTSYFHGVSYTSFSQIGFGLAFANTSLDGYLGEDEDSFGYRKGHRGQSYWSDRFGATIGPPDFAGEVDDFAAGDIVGFRYDPVTAKARAFLNSRIVFEFTLDDWAGIGPVYLGVTFFCPGSLTVLVQTGAEPGGGQSQTRATGHMSPQLQLEAHDVDIQIGRAINAQGEDSARDDVSLEDVFAGMRETLRGAQEHAHASEVKDEALEEVRLPVDALRFTQAGCSRSFSCGTTIQQTASEIANGNVDPLKAPWCRLRVVNRNGMLFSCDSRRLWSMKEAQRQMRERDPEKVLYTRATVHRWRREFDVFLKHLDHACSPADGGDIYVRGPKRRRNA